MTLRFDQPEWLWGLAIAAAIILPLWFWIGGMTRARKSTVLLARLTLVALLLAVLAGASAVRTSNRMAVVAVIDVSGSVRAFGPTDTLPDGRRRNAIDRAREFLRAATARRGNEDLLGIVVFDGDRLAVSLPRGPGSAAGPAIDDAPATSTDNADALDAPLEVLANEGTDIAAALRFAAGLIPADATGRILLISDGVETSGDALAAAREVAGRLTAARSPSAPTPSTAAATSAAPAGNAPSPTGAASAARPDRSDRLRIDVLPINYAVDREIVVESVDVPGRAPEDSVVTARVTLNSTTDATGTLRVIVDGAEAAIAPTAGGSATTPPTDSAAPAEPLRGRRIRLAPGRNIQLVNVKLPQGRVHSVRAIFEPDAPDPGQQSADTLAANNSADGVVVSPGAGAVLLIDGVANAAPNSPVRTLARVLQREGQRVDVLPPESFPSDLLRLEAYDLVMLYNAPADVIGPAEQTRLVQYVTDLGGGLVMIGGPNSFGAGSWRGGPLEPLLPVKLDLPERLVVPSAAVMLVIDCSGSMGFSVMGSSRTQQQIANEGAAVAIRSLEKTDLLGIIAFNSRSEVLVPLARNADPDANARTVLSISPGGGTNLPPAMREALAQMKPADAKVRHCIILSDGRSMGTDQLPALAQQFADAGILVSTIAVGDQADTEALRNIAEIGRGQYFRVVDPTILPRVFLRAVQVERKPLIREDPFTPLVVNALSPVLAAVDLPSMPPLGGLVLTQPRPEPTIVQALFSPQGEPVLAHWQTGLGQVAAFTSDAHLWAKPWLDWPGYQRLWVNLARAIARPTGQRNAELSAEIVDGRMILRLEAADDAGRPMDGLTAAGAVYGPDGARRDVRLAAVGPGLYEGSVAVDRSGSYVATIAPRLGPRAMRPIIAAASSPAGAEFRSLRSNPVLLEQLAAESGGRVLDWAAPQAADLFNRRGAAPKESRQPLRPWLIGLAVLVLLLDVATRRVAWDRFVSAQFGAGLLADARRAVRDRSRQVAGTLERLRRTDERLERAADTYDQKRLTDQDAAELARQQRQRRAARRAAAGQPPQASTSPTSPNRPEPLVTIARSPDAPPPALDSKQPAAIIERHTPPSAPPSTNDASAAGLAAAKRRAAERFKGENPG